MIGNINDIKNIQQSQEHLEIIHMPGRSSGLHCTARFYLDQFAKNH